MSRERNLFTRLEEVMDMSVAREDSTITRINRYRLARRDNDTVTLF